MWEALKTWRERNGLTYAEAGERLGTSAQNVHRWETQGAVPRRAALEKIGAATNGEVPPSSFYATASASEAA